MAVRLEARAGMAAVMRTSTLFSPNPPLLCAFRSCAAKVCEALRGMDLG